MCPIVWKPSNFCFSSITSGKAVWKTSCNFRSNRMWTSWFFTRGNAALERNSIKLQLRKRQSDWKQPYNAAIASLPLNITSRSTERSNYNQHCQRTILRWTTFELLAFVSNLQFSSRYFSLIPTRSSFLGTITHQRTWTCFVLHNWVIASKPL